MLKIFGKYRDYASLPIRILLGLTLLFAHGLPKLTSPDRWQGEGENMAHLGITFAPVFWGFIVSTAVGIIVALTTTPTDPEIVEEVMGPIDRAMK